MPELTLEQALPIAMECYQAGRLAEAEAIYRQVLARQPDNVEAWHMLGAIAHQAGKNQDAAQLMSRAVQLNARIPDYHNNLGVVLLALKNYDAAIASFQNALVLKTFYPEAYNNLGNALMAKQNTEAAIRAY